MRSSVKHWVFIGTFFALTLLPGIQMLSRISPEFVVDEQRALAAAPDPSAPAVYPRQANAWFSDHFGFRSLLIRLKAEIDYRLFRVSDKVYVGRDGYLFYRSTLDIEKPNVDRYLAGNTDKIVAGMQRYAQALNAKGIGMVVEVNLLGDRLIADKLPKEFAARSPLRQIDNLTRKLAAVPDITYIDSTEILSQTYKTRPIFHRTDFHWNDPAAFPVAQAMVGAMSKAQGLPDTVWKHELHIDPLTLSGGVARFMPLLHPPSEDTIVVRQDWAWPAGFTSTAGKPPVESETRTAKGTPGLLGPALLVGDSFLDGLIRCGLQAYFSKTDRIRWAPDITLDTITEAIQPDTRWIVIQFIEVDRPAFDAFADEKSVESAIRLLQTRQ